MTAEPITPPPELVEQWLHAEGFPFRTGSHDVLAITRDRLDHVTTQAARWGADQELEACCEWVEEYAEFRADALGVVLRAARRPKPPSLKEQAMAHLDVMVRDGHYLPELLADIRRALEALPDA